MIWLLQSKTCPSDSYSDFMSNSRNFFSKPYNNPKNTNESGRYKGKMNKKKGSHHSSMKQKNSGSKKTTITPKREKKPTNKRVINKISLSTPGKCILFLMIHSNWSNSRGSFKCPRIQIAGRGLSSVQYCARNRLWRRRRAWQSQTGHGHCGRDWKWQWGLRITPFPSD